MFSPNLFLSRLKEWGNLRHAWLRLLLLVQPLVFLDHLVQFEPHQLLWCHCGHAIEWDGGCQLGLLLMNMRVTMVVMVLISLHLLCQYCRNSLCVDIE